MAEQKTNGATSVEILGTEYRLVGEEESYLKELAQFVDRELRRCSEEKMVYSSGRLGILTCLNIADQFYKLKDEYKKLASSTIESIKKLIDKIDKILDNAKHKTLGPEEPTEAISTKA